MCPAARIRRRPLIHFAPHAGALPHPSDPLHPRHRVPLLQRVHRRADHGARRHADHPGARAERRAELSPDSSVRAVRPSFRRHHRRRPADRPGPGGAVRLRARPDLARRPGSAWPARSTTSSSCGHRRAVADGRLPRSRARRSARSPAAPPPSPSSSSSSSRSPASGWRSSTRSRRAPGARSPSAPRSRSRSSWASTCIASARGGLPRRPSIGVHRPAARGHPRQADRRVGRRRLVPPLARAADRGDGRLRLHRVRAAGLAAALPARLPQLVHEDRDDRLPRGRRHHRQSGAADARRQRSSPPAAARSSRARSSPSRSSPSRAARSPDSTR